MNSLELLMKKNGGNNNKQTLVWNHFNIESARDPKTHRRNASCKYCDQKFPSARLSELKKHLILRCERISPNFRTEIINELMEQSTFENEPSVYTPYDHSLPVKRKFNGSEMQAFSTIPHNPFHENHLKQDIDNTILQWFATSKIPLEAIDNPYATRLFALLRQDYEKPTSYLLKKYVNDQINSEDGNRLQFQHHDAVVGLNDHIQLREFQESFGLLGDDSNQLDLPK